MFSISDSAKSELQITFMVLIIEMHYYTILFDIDYGIIYCIFIVLSVDVRIQKKQTIISDIDFSILQTTFI